MLKIAGGEDTLFSSQRIEFYGFYSNSLIEYKDDEASLKKDVLRADEIKLVMENVNFSHNTAI